MSLINTNPRSFPPKDSCSGERPHVRAGWRANRGCRGVEGTVWQFLKGVVELPDLTASLKAYAGDLARKAHGSVEHMVTAVMWLMRYYRISQHLDYPPLFFTQSFRRPDEYVQAWSLPVAASSRRVLYVAKEKEGLRGVFFPSEIVPAPHMDLRDTPIETHVERWRDEEELQHPAR